MLRTVPEPSVLWAPEMSAAFCAAAGAENPYKMGLEDLGSIIHPVTQFSWDPGWVTELDAVGEGGERRGEKTQTKNQHKRLQAPQEQGLVTPSATAAPLGLLA